jgi:hypothetical protein
MRNNYFLNMSAERYRYATLAGEQQLLYFEALQLLTEGLMLK